MIFCRKLSRNAWAQPQLQSWIVQRGGDVGGGGELKLDLEKGFPKDAVHRTQKEKEELAGLQSTMWPYSLGTQHMAGRVRHKVPPAHMFSNRTSTTIRYQTEAPEYTGDALESADKSGNLFDRFHGNFRGTAPRKHPWFGTSLANQRYQYHMMLSQVPMKHDNWQDPDFATSRSKHTWNESQSATEGSKTDTLVPGSSCSNSLRWTPLPAGPLTDLHVLAAKRAASPERTRTPCSFGERALTPSSFGGAKSSTRARSAGPVDNKEVPLTIAGFIQASRTAKEEERLTRERRVMSEYAKRRGVQDIESWLEGLAENKENQSGKNQSNRWSSIDKHEWIALSADGLTVMPSYKSVKDYNGLVRAEQGYYSGRHYWEITLERFSVVGQGWHYVGVASPDVPLQGQPGEILMGSRNDSACLCLENCQKLRETGRPIAYGKRAIKEGNVLGILLDLDLGELSFFLNGDDMGVAFYGMRGPLCPAIEMGMMVGQNHKYLVNFLPKPPPRKKFEGPPVSDEQVFRQIKTILPVTSMKCGQEGFGAVLSFPAPPFTSGRPITIHPQNGDFLLYGYQGVNAKGPKVRHVASLNNEARAPLEEFFAR